MGRGGGWPRPTRVPKCGGRQKCGAGRTTGASGRGAASGGRWWPTGLGLASPALACAGRSQSWRAENWVPALHGRACLPRDRRCVPRVEDVDVPPALCRGAVVAGTSPPPCGSALSAGVHCWVGPGQGALRPMLFRPVGDGGAGPIPLWTHCSLFRSMIYFIACPVGENAGGECARGGVRPCRARAAGGVGGAP